MRWDLAARGLLGYSAGYGGLTLVAVLGLAALARADVALVLG